MVCLKPVETSSDRNMFIGIFCFSFTNKYSVRSRNNLLLSDKQSFVARSLQSRDEYDVTCCYNN